MIRHRTESGEIVEFDEEYFAQGGMKDVHWGKDRKYVVAFYRDKQDENSRERIRNIVIFYHIVGPYKKTFPIVPSF